MASGWAYVGCADFATGSGPTGSVQFHVEGTQISGSDHLMFHTGSNIPDAHGNLHPPYTLVLSGNMIVTGALSASVINYENITVIDATGSTFFGNTNDDIHARTGSLRASTLQGPVFWATASADGTAPYVGIGTPSPSKHLHLYGSSGEVELRIQSDTSYASIVEKDNAELIIQNAATDGVIIFHDDTAERMRIDANGKVGIGTTSPISALEIEDGLTTGGAILTLGTKEPSVVANDVLGRINFYAPLDTGTDSDEIGASIAAIAQATFSDSVNSTALVFQTGKSEAATTKMVIDEDGKVGIGSTSPSGLLHVSSSSDETLFRIDGGTGPAAGTPIIFAAGSSGSTGVGSVGINTATPNAAKYVLDTPVSGVIKGGNIEMGSWPPSVGYGFLGHSNQDHHGVGGHNKYNLLIGNNGSLDLNAAGGNLGFRTGATLRAAIDATNNNFGIGEGASSGWTPAALLHVSGSPGALFQIDAASGSVPSANAPILFVTGGLIGRVGIGTAAPTEILSVNGGVSGSSTLQIAGDADFGDNLNVTGAISGSNSLEVVGEAILGTTLTVSGNVGINTQPSDGILLHVSGTTYAGNDGALLQIDSASGSVPATNLPILYVSGGGNGHIGLGTTTPAAPLDVRGSLHVGIDDFGHDVKFFGDTPGQYMLWDQSADELVLAGDTKLSFHDAAAGENIIATSDGHLEVNAGTTLDITAPTVDINAATAVTIDGPAVTIADSAAGKPVLTLKTTHTTKTSSGELQFLKDAADTEDGEVLGQITFYGEDEGNNNTAFAKIVAEISESDETDEAGKLSFYVAESDGTNTALTAGLVLEGEHATDGEVDVTIGAGNSSLTSISGMLKTAANVAIGGDVIGNCALHVSGTQHISNEDALFRIDTLSGSVPAANLPILYVSGGGNGHIGLGTTTPAVPLDVRGSLHVGVDGTGHDVKFFGDTPDQYMLWDEDHDELVLAGDTKLSFHDGDGGENIIATSNGHLEVNAGTTLDMTAPTVDINASTAVTIDGPSVLIANNVTNTPVVEIRNAHNGGTAGILKFNNTEGGTVGTNNDVLGTIQFFGNNNDGDGASIQYAGINSQIADRTDGAEGGKLTFQVASHDGELESGLILADGNADHEVDVTIASGASSVTAVSGLLTTVGSIAPTTDNAVDLGAADKRWANLYTGDLHLANDRGDWTVVEEENYLTIRNNKSGKRFKLLMEEIED